MYTGITSVMFLSFKFLSVFICRFFTTTTTSTFSPLTTTVERNGSAPWKRVTAKSNMFTVINVGWLSCHRVQAICLLFLHTEIKNNNLVTKYHPNFWMDGKWRCCQQSEKLATGCQVYNPLDFGMWRGTLCQMCLVVALSQLFVLCRGFPDWLRGPVVS